VQFGALNVSKNSKHTISVRRTEAKQKR